MTEYELTKLKLDAVLAEYESVRNEKVRRIELQVKMLEWYLLGAVGIYSVMIQYKFWDPLPIIGVAGSIVTLFWAERQRVIQVLRNYIRDEIERKKIPMLINDLNGDVLLNWQNYYAEKFHKLSAWLYNLIFIPFFAAIILPPLLFCFLVVFKQNYSSIGFSTEYSDALNWWQATGLRWGFCLFLGIYMILNGILSFLITFFYRIHITSD